MSGVPLPSLPASGDESDVYLFDSGFLPKPEIHTGTKDWEFSSTPHTRK